MTGQTLLQLHNKDLFKVRLLKRKKLTIQRVKLKQPISMVPVQRGIRFLQRSRQRCIHKLKLQELAPQVTQLIPRLIHLNLNYHHTQVAKISRQYQAITMTMLRSNKKIGDYIALADAPLGHGAFGQVYKCKEESTSAFYAMKIISKQKASQQSPFTISTMLRELQIHKSLSHPNIIQCKDVIQTSHNFYIVMQLCPDGSLRDLLRREGGRLSEADARYCIMEICKAFEEMVAKGVVHRDVKPENILIKGKQLKIGDFGWAKVLETGKQMTKTVAGTPIYMSPQILNSQRYSSKCDIWSIGVIFYELLFGKHPWIANSRQRLHMDILQKPLFFPENIKVSDLTKHFISSCLKVEESERLAWVDVYEHPIMDQQIRQKGKRWRQRYINTANKLDQLVHTLSVPKLIGGFLQFRVPSLDFNNFSKLLNFLLPFLSPLQISTTYQLLDKDFDGVVDFLEIMTVFTSIPLGQLKILNALIEAAIPHRYLKDYNEFVSACDELGIELSQDVDEAWKLVKDIQLRE